MTCSLVKLSALWFGLITEPIGGEITVASESEIVGNIPITSAEKALAEQLRNYKFSRSVKNPQRKGCYYTPIPRVIKQKGIHGQDLTCLNLDKVQIAISLSTAPNLCYVFTLVQIWSFVYLCVYRHNCWKTY